MAGRKSGVWLGLPVVVGVTLLGATSSGTYMVEYPFRGQADGARPLGLVLDADGNQYGETQRGGSNCPDGDGVNGCGTVFRISADGTFKVLATFQGPNGANGKSLPGVEIFVPPPQPLMLRQKTLYGITTYGGASDLGVVFSVQTDGSGYTVLHQFAGSDGANPVGTIGVDQSRNIFGVTTYGGIGYTAGTASSGNGVLYKLSPDGTFSTLHSFTGKSADNYKPLGVVVDRSGVVYGSTSGSGSTFIGTAYQFDQAAGHLTTIHKFVYPDDLPVISGLDSKGNLYGYAGGVPGNGGSVFKLATATSGFTYTRLFKFDPNDLVNGSNPSGMDVGADGSLMGVTTYGPASLYPAEPDGKGTIFSYQAGALTTIYAFNGGYSNGIYPIGPPIAAKGGLILGTTFLEGGGCALRNLDGLACGVVFSYAP